MTSKYDIYWHSHLDAILALFDQARTEGTSAPLPLADLDALGQRGSWYGKLEIVRGQNVYDSAAHMAALGAVLTPDLPPWAQEHTWTVTVSKELQLAVDKTEPQKTNWFENAYRNAKQTETITRAEAHLGPLLQQGVSSGWCQTSAGRPVYVLFTTQRDRWLAPRCARLEDTAAEGGEAVISATDDDSGRFDLWIIPAAEVMAAIQQAEFTPSLDRGNAYNFNLQIDEATDIIRQLNWDIRPYRRESERTDLTRARFWPADGPQRPEDGPVAPGTARAGDLTARLAQWRIEATDPSHPNHYHANLDVVADSYARISALLQKLRTDPESFGREDVVALFGALNSGQRTKNLVARGNPLPDLRTALLALIDGAGAASERIATAASQIKHAGFRIVGELYGWANAETAPLYNTCATDALSYLGYLSGSIEYDAFVAAHEQFKQVYLAHAGRLRPDLPVNLEVDKLYNVIDKVDMQQKTPPQPDGLYRVGAGGQEHDRGQPVADAAFSQQAFELLKGLHREPTKAYYSAHKDEFRAEIEVPFQELMGRVAKQLPEPVRKVMETQQGVFGRILKNDWGKGGAWDFYWGAFYPKGGKRTQEAQLFTGIHPGFVHFGFSVGAYASEQRERFQRNCKAHHAAMVKLMPEHLADTRLVFGHTEGITIAADGRVSSEKTCTWEEFLADPERANCTIGVVIPRSTLPGTSAEALATDIVQTFAHLFPLVLLATETNPLPAIEEYLEPSPPELSKPEYTLAQCAAETGFDSETLAGWVRAIERKRQAILYGPPGTGKTFVAERLARHLIGGGDGFSDLVQFHPAYAYEDFIQGIRPQTTAGGGLTYPLLPGRFLEFCTRAARYEGRCVLIIDEINRANLARVFGELMYLLEYRDREVPLAGGGRLRIPENVRLIGTMNTADRSIALVDHALRRRFAFLALYPRHEILREFQRRANPDFPVERLIQVLNRLNDAIYDRHYHVGITFFLRAALPTELADIWRMEIEPYLEEFFFDQPDKAKAFRWESVQAELLP
jgi:MoxR-like ATPase